MNTSSFTATERHSVTALALILSLRLIGLFMILPMFSLYALSLEHATATSVGIAAGIYGLTQALAQLPFGWLSDRWARKPVIAIGLLLFIFGSILAAFSQSIYTLIFARALQGTGAIGSTALAFIADVTRDHQRTKAMAIAGISIGASFGLAMMLGPALASFCSTSGLFLVSAGLGCLAILCLSTLPSTTSQKTLTAATQTIAQLFFYKNLFFLNLTILILHAIFASTFVALPMVMTTTLRLAPEQHWTLYLPALITAIVMCFFMIYHAERQQRIKFYFFLSSVLLSVSQLIMLHSPSFAWMLITLICFFSGFTTLEGFLPSLVSKHAPAQQKGAAMGLYSMFQFFGIFIGGLGAGSVQHFFGTGGIFWFNVSLAALLCLLAYFVQLPPNLIHRVIHLPDETREEIIAALQKIPGIIDINTTGNSQTICVTMNSQTRQHPDYIHVKSLFNLTD